jgi:hypothetical protein
MKSFGNFKFLVGKNGSHSEMRISGCDTGEVHQGTAFSAIAMFAVAGLHCLEFFCLHCRFTVRDWVFLWC